MSEVYEYCDMICPVQAFSPNWHIFVYWKLAGEVQYEATVLQIALSDRIYICEQLGKFHVSTFGSFSGIIIENLPNIQKLDFKKMTKNYNIMQTT